MTVSWILPLCSGLIWTTVPWHPYWATLAPTRKHTESFGYSSGSVLLWKRNQVLLCWYATEDNEGLHDPNEMCIGKWSCRASVFLPSSDLSLSKSYEDFQGFRTQSPVSGEHSIQLQDLPTTPDYRVISTTTARSATANPGKIIVCTILLSNSNHSLHIILKF